MYRIAICDDDELYSRVIREVILSQANKPDQLEFYHYTSGEALIFYLNLNFQLIFLDIQMKGMDGNETAKEIRRHSSDPVLVFYTGTQLPTTESFKVQPFRYILKDHRHEQLSADMPEILEYMVSRSEEIYVCLPFEKDVYRVKPGDIIFVKVQKYGSLVYVSKRAQIRGLDAVIKTRRKLSDIKEELEKVAEGAFGSPHYSYLLNYKYVTKVEKLKVYFAEQEHVNITRRNREVFEDRLMRYMVRNHSDRRMKRNGI